MKEKHYEVVIIGGGISGGALLYELARYTDVKSIALIEKYSGLATLNSKGTANSQTIHCGDIETNYTFEKAQKVSKTARMVVKYGLQHGYQGKYMFDGQKMAIGVGDVEVDYIKNRFNEFKEIYPYLEFYDKAELAKIEPKIILNSDGTHRAENVVGMGVKSGEYTTVDYGAFTTTFIENAKKEGGECDVYLNSRVDTITQNADKYYIQTANGLSISADFVVVNAGAHSLYLAHKMGYGLDFGCLPVAGSFYLTKKKLLNGKVYMVQNPKLPFAALHGDPDILADGCTRFGPTALALPKLERYHDNWGSFLDFCKTLNFDSTIAGILFDLFKDSDIRNYILRNFLFEVPYLNKKLFVKDAQKIVPSLSTNDIYYAKGCGGVRPQVLNKTEKKLMLGEASINPKTGIIFNMTPSPGATSCLGNALRDVREVCEYLGKNFNEAKLNEELFD